MSLFGGTPNIGDFQREAWAKALHIFPPQPGMKADCWFTKGLVTLDLDGTIIGRHLGPEWMSFPVWGHRRPVGMSRAGLVIPFDPSASLDREDPVQVPWTSIKQGYDSTHFQLAADVIVTLQLNDEAAIAVRRELEASHG